MNDWQWRLAIFFGVWLTLMLAEHAIGFARNPALWTRAGRHLTMALLGTALTRLLLPLGAIGGAAWAAQQNVGAFHQIAAPVWIEFLLALIALDLAIYWQHRATHAWPPLWRLHRVHHTDAVLDASTALRFHPIEIALSMAYKLAVVVALGIDPLAVLVFEIVLNATALFSHANVQLPERIDRALARLIVTPAMHRVHHAPDALRTNSNYGFCLSIWDRLFGSFRGFRHRPDGEGFGVAGMVADESVVAMLKRPFGGLR